MGDLEIKENEYIIMEFLFGFMIDTSHILHKCAILLTYKFQNYAQKADISIVTKRSGYKDITEVIYCTTLLPFVRV